MPSPIDVVAGVLTDVSGRVLLSQRCTGSHLAGSWEFPGGKREPGETLEDALRRELNEELGITAQALSPLISVPWRYPRRSMRLSVWRVISWSGTPASCEHQPLRWQRPEHIDPTAMPPADRPVLAALRLPPRYPITPPSATLDDVPDMVEQALARGERLLQLRLPEVTRDAVAALASGLVPHCDAVGAHLLLNHDVALALDLGLGVHLRASQLGNYSRRPVPTTQWCAASCHNAEDLAQAQRLGVDFATLSPVWSTPSHAQATALGWQRFAELAGEAALPVYALGGLNPGELDDAVQAGAQGVAGIRSFW